MYNEPKSETEDGEFDPYTVKGRASEAAGRDWVYTLSEQVCTLVNIGYIISY